METPNQKPTTPGLPPIHLVIYLEATCDADRRLSKYEMEIIEIGAVLVDTETLIPVDELGTFVKPVRHPVLTPFCTELTTITQADVDHAPLFPEALAKVRRLIDGRDALFFRRLRKRFGGAIALRAVEVKESGEVFHSTPSRRRTPAQTTLSGRMRKWITPEVSSTEAAAPAQA